MRNFHIITKTFSFLFILIVISSCATVKEKQARISLVDSLIKADHFKFVAQQAHPMRANLVSPQLQQLDGSYYLKVSKDTLRCYLPYFGVAQQAPYGSTENGIQFTSTEFTYSKNQTTKRLEITIIPKNVNNANRLFLSISESGSATLNVSSTHRDPISFNGTIERP